MSREFDEMNENVENTNENIIKDLESLERNDEFSDIKRECDDKDSNIQKEAYGQESFDKGQETEEYYKEETPHIIKKKKSFTKKIAAIISSAALFGAVAGGTMVGIQYGFAPEKRAESVIIGKQNTGNKTTNTISTASTGSNSIGDVSNIVSKAMPSVVAINATSTMSAYTWFGRTQTYESNSSGSGIIIGNNADELLMVTNNHVVENTDKLSVVFIDGKEVQATVKGGDSEADIAVIAVKLSDLSEETKKAIEVATIGDSDKLKVGEGVVAIGNALGYGQSVTVGYISALNRDVEIEDGTKRKLLQTDAAINPGNSGGALVNANGELVAINSAKYSSTSVEGMGYAIPINEVQDLIENLSKRETRTKVDEASQGYLGIQGQNIDEEMAKSYDMPKGIYVYKLVEGGGASKSELKEKDIITKLDGERVVSMQELKEALSYYKSGESVELTIQRLDGSEYKEQTLKVTLGKRTTQD